MSGQKKTIAGTSGGAAQPFGPEPPDLYELDYEHYVIYARSTGDEDIRRFTLLKTIIDLGEQNVKEIIPINRRLYKIECSNKEVANHFIIDQPFINIGIKCTVPFINKYSTVIINDVETDISDEYLTFVLNKAGKLHNFYRFTRTLQNDKNETVQIKTKTIKATFEGDYLAKYVYVAGMRLQMKPYIPKLKMCFICCTYGHYDKFCKKQMYKKCKSCSGTCTNKCTSDRLNCPSCEGEHCFGDKSCITREKEGIIQEIMVLKKLSYTEARSDFFGKKENLDVPSYGEAMYEREFPELKRKKTTDNNNNATSKQRDFRAERQSKINNLQLKIQHNKNKYKSLKNMKLENNRIEKSRDLRNSSDINQYNNHTNINQIDFSDNRLLAFQKADSSNLSLQNLKHNTVNRNNNTTVTEINTINQNISDVEISDFNIQTTNLNTNCTSHITRNELEIKTTFPQSK